MKISPVGPMTSCGVHHEAPASYHLQQEELLMEHILYSHKSHPQHLPQLWQFSNPAKDNIDKTISNVSTIV
jgi:hypothetical protein